MAWTLADIRAEWRRLTGLSQTGDISDSDVNSLINDYYSNYFPDEANVSNFQTEFTQATTATDTGEYTLAQTVIDIEPPVTCNGVVLSYYSDKALFFADYPNDEHIITAPGLAIGSASKASVANAAFSYAVEGWSYSKAAAETLLSGDAVPVNKYGAWLLTIDDEGTITVTAAGDNATGYLTPALALAALQTEESGQAVMGFVTVVCSSGAFTPGTTELDASGVTATYTDGRLATRNCPEAVLIAGNRLYVRPKPDDIYQIASVLTLQRPTTMSADSDAPTDEKWGPAIAEGAALMYLNSIGDTGRFNEILPVLQYRTASIRAKRWRQMSERTATPSF